MDPPRTQRFTPSSLVPRSVTIGQEAVTSVPLRRSPPIFIPITRSLDPCSVDLTKSIELNRIDRNPAVFRRFLFAQLITFFRHKRGWANSISRPRGPRTSLPNFHRFADSSDVKWAYFRVNRWRRAGIDAMLGWSPVNTHQLTRTTTGDYVCATAKRKSSEMRENDRQNGGVNTYTLAYYSRVKTRTDRSRQGRRY